MLTVPPGGEHHQKWWQNRSGIIHRATEDLARVSFLITDSSVNNFCWWGWITWLHIHMVILSTAPQGERELFTREIACSLPSRFSLAVLLFHYLPSSLTTFPSAPPLPEVHQFVPTATNSWHLQDSGEKSELWLKGSILCNIISLPLSQAVATLCANTGRIFPAL